MELRIDEQGKELKYHGTYGFPVNVGRKRVSSYATGSFPWHWHDEVEFTLVFSGAMEYRVNESGYILRAGEGLFCNADALHTGGRWKASDCDYASITVHPRFLYGYEGSVLRTKYVAGVAVSSVHLTEAVPWQKQALASLKKVYQLLLEKPELYELLNAVIETVRDAVCMKMGTDHPVGSTGGGNLARAFYAPFETGSGRLYAG